MSASLISVVIPTHNRRAEVLATLEALARQTLDPALFDVTVVLDACTDDTADALGARAWPFILRMISPAGRGAAFARNAGAALATAPRVVFLDDDITADPGFLAAHLAAGQGGRVVVGQSAPAIEGRGWFFQGLRIWWQDRFWQMARPGHRFAHTDVMSGNLSVPADLFRQVGGFDTALMCREDYELGYRLIKAGARLAYAPDARGMHHDRSTLRRNVVRVGMEGRADVQIARKHPELYWTLMVRNLAAGYRSTKVLRFAVFTVPGVGFAAQRGLMALIPLMERMGWRGLWNRACHAVRAFSYYHGVAAETGSPAGLHALAAGYQSKGKPPFLVLDLMDGVEAALTAVAAQPGLAGLYLYFGAWEVARLEPEPGAEPITVDHVRALLADRVDHWAAFAMANDALPPLPSGDPVTVVAEVRAEGVSLAEVDVTRWHLTPRGGRLAYPMRLLVRAGATPLGWVQMDAPPAPGTFWAALRREVMNHTGIGLGLLRLNMLGPVPEPAALPPISVVICSKDRTDSLRRCLGAVQALDYPAFEVVVVDNAPSTAQTQALVASLPGVRYVREDRPGLDWARNAGIGAAQHGIIAYTDDDTMVDPGWLRGLAAAFEPPEVQVVTGLVLPMTLDHPAQLYFEDVYGGMGKGFKPWVKSRALLGDRGILWASGCGVGANMAFRRGLFDRVGLFDPGLDVGTATRGGGDIEMFHRAMAGGAVLAYAPGAMLWHEHRADDAALLRQIGDNGSGFAAFLLACWRNRTVPRGTILRFAARDWVLDWFVRRALRPGRHRRATIRAEFAGLMAGRRGYLAAQARARELAGDRAGELAGELAGGK